MKQPNLFEFKDAKNFQGINPYFAEWRNSLVLQTMSANGHSHTPEYTSHHEKRFLEQCKQHRQVYSKPVNGREVITIVHPFYPLIEIEEEQPKEFNNLVDKYVRNLTALLKQTPRSKFAIVPVDLPEHYSIFSSLLVEKGIFDSVIFTKYERGAVLGGENLNSIRHSSKVFLAGSYMTHCFAKFATQVFDMKNQEQLRTIDSLILPHPTRATEYFPIYLRVRDFNLGDLFK